MRIDRSGNNGTTLCGACVHSREQQLEAAQAKVAESLLIIRGEPNDEEVLHFAWVHGEIGGTRSLAALLADLGYHIGIKDHESEIESMAELAGIFRTSMFTRSMYSCCVRRMSFSSSNRPCSFHFLTSRKK